MSVILSELENIPKLIEKTLKTDKLVQEIAKKYQGVNNCLFLGCGINFPVALEELA